LNDAPRVSALYRYPVKSCRGQALSEAELDPYGLAGDRRWMVVDEAGAFLTQRQYPKMALVVPSLGPDALTLNAPGMESLPLPLARERTERDGVTIWGDRCAAWDEGERAAAWFSEVLGLRCRLVHTGDGFERPVKPEHARAGDQVAFADGFPFLLISQAALDDLNARLEAPLEMIRFRPNLVVSGTAPFAEDGWGRIRIGATAFRVVKPCARCAITTVDPATGARGQEPLRTLSTYRRTPEGKVNFGQNLIHEPKRGTLRVGDAVTVEV